MTFMNKHLEMKIAQEHDKTLNLLASLALTPHPTPLINPSNQTSMEEPQFNSDQKTKDV